jgi:diacylglycerol kinase family enzyme
LIVNPAAGSYKRGVSPESLRRLFARYGIEAEISLVGPGENITALAQARALENQIVVAGGGDGTVSSVSAAIAGAGAILGVLPLGTLNHFARDLGIPFDIEAAVRIIAEREIKSVDVGEVNGRVFINNSSLGIYPLLVWQRRKLERTGLSKWVAFGLAAVKVLRRPSFVTVRLKVDGQELIRKTPFVLVGNNEYEIEGSRIGIRPRLDAGHLAVYVAPVLSRVGFVGLFFRAIFGKLKGQTQFDALSTGQLWIETSRNRVLVAFDGEVDRMTSPLHYRIRAGALKVIVPRKS